MWLIPVLIRGGGWASTGGRISVSERKFQSITTRSAESEKKKEKTWSGTEMVPANPYSVFHRHKHQTQILKLNIHVQPANNPKQDKVRKVNEINQQRSKKDKNYLNKIMCTNIHD